MGDRRFVVGPVRHAAAAGPRPPQPLAPDNDPEFFRELSERIRRGQTDDPPRT